MLQNMLILPLLLQLSLWAGFILGAPTATAEVSAAMNNSWQYGTGGGILGFIILVLDLIVFVEVLKSNRPPGSKLLWCLVVFFFPVIGLVVYWLFSNRDAHRGGDYETLP